MFSIQDLLARHPIPGLKQSETRRVIAEVLTRIVGVPISPKSIQFVDGNLSLSVPPVLKSAVTVHQEEIRKALQQEDIEIKGIR